MARDKGCERRAIPRPARIDTKGYHCPPDTALDERDEMFVALVDQNPSVAIQSNKSVVEELNGLVEPVGRPMVELLQENDIPA